MNNQEAKDYLGKQIAKRVIRMGGTQKEIGKDLGISSATVSNIINGYYKRVSIRMFVRLARELDCDVEINVIDHIPEEQA